MARQVFLFFLGRRLRSGRTLAIALLFFLVAFTVLLAMTDEQESMERMIRSSWGFESYELPAVTLGSGSAHDHVADAVTYRYLNSVPARGGLLLPLRFALPWLVVLLPLLGLIGSFSAVSEDLESGRSQTLLSLPVDPARMGVARALAEGAAVGLVLCTSLPLALVLVSLLFGVVSTAQEVERALVFLCILVVYTSLFALAGNLVSAWSRKSSRSLWICAGLFAGLVFLDMAASNATLRAADFYAPIPPMTREVNIYLGDAYHRLPPGASNVPADVTAYLGSLSLRAQDLAREEGRRYQRERWFGVVAVSRLVRELGNQVLQDSYGNATDVFLPVGPGGHNPSLRKSLLCAWPEAAWLLFLWLILIAANVRVLSRMEV